MKLTILRIAKAFPKLSLALSIVLFIAVEAIFSACTNHECLGFEDSSFDLWFPYKSLDSIYFANTSNKMDTIIIGSIYKTEPYQTYKECESTISISSLSSPTRSKLYIHYSKQKGYNSLSVQLQSTTFNFSAVADNGLTANKSMNGIIYYTQSKPSLTLNGKTFADVQTFEIDSTFLGLRDIRKIWLAKNQGIVAFEKRTNELWVKQ